MADKKTIGISSIMAVLISSGFMVAPGMIEETKYYCDGRPELGLVSCDDFSKYVADNGKCVNVDSANFICRSGWLEVVNDTVIDFTSVNVEDNVLREEYVCGPQSCEVLK